MSKIICRQSAWMCLWSASWRMQTPDPWIAAPLPAPKSPMGPEFVHCEFAIRLCRPRSKPEAAAGTRYLSKFALGRYRNRDDEQPAPTSQAIDKSRPTRTWNDTDTHPVTTPPNGLEELVNTFRIHALAAILILITRPAVAGNERKPGLGLSVGAGPAVIQFDSNFKVTNRDNDQHLFVDTEGTFGLPSVAHSPLITGSYRFTRAHGLTFSYFDIRRKNRILNAELDLGDYTAYGDIEIRDTSSFYSLGYSYALYEDERSFVLASVGLFGLDLGLALEAKGGIRSPMEVLEESSYNESIGFFAPLPLFGLDFWWSYTERWGDRPHHRFLQRRLGICAGHLNPRGLQTEQPIGCADWYEIFLCQRGLER